MAKKLYEESNIQAIADAIRGKCGTTCGYKTCDMAAAIDSITTGGGSGNGVDVLAAIDNDTLETYFSEELTEIRTKTFMYTTALTEVICPNVTVLGDSCFYQATGLVTARFASAETVNQVAFSGCTSLSELTMPNAVTLGGSAVYGCTSLASIDLPSATTLDSTCFCNCSKLSEVNLPSVTSMGGSCFRGCTSLVQIDLPQVNSAQSRAFEGCTALTKVSLGVASSVIERAFKGCTQLETLILRKADAMATLGNVTAFTDTPIASGTGYIYVPSALVDTYKAGTNWSTYADQIRAIEDYPDITGG